LLRRVRWPERTLRMSTAAVSLSWRYAVVLVGLAGLAVGVMHLGGLRVSRELVTASLRAVVQLGVVALVIVLVLRSWGLTAAFVLAMVGVAAVTAARRVKGTPGAWWLGVPIV